MKKGETSEVKHRKQQNAAQTAATHHQGKHAAAVTSRAGRQWAKKELTRGRGRERD
jgi:hypothetical protein